MASATEISRRLFGESPMVSGVDAYEMTGGSGNLTFDPPLRGFYVKTDGNLVVVTPLGEDRTFATSSYFTTKQFVPIGIKTIKDATTAVILGVK